LILSQDIRQDFSHNTRRFVDPSDGEVQRHGSSSKKNRGDATGYHVTTLGSR